MPHLFCFGLGYCARHLAQRLIARGWTVAATARDPGQATRLAGIGVRPHLLTGSDPAADLADATHLLASVPPESSGDPMLVRYGAALAARGPGLQWVGYLSTTGVYGDRQGGWVDETTPLAPTGERGQRRLIAETEWLALWRDHGVPVHLFRLAGIYGPERNALATIESGRAQRVIKPGQVFSRIHVADIGAVLEASIAAPAPGAAYNVCDDDPAPPDEVLSYAASLLGLPPPPAVPFAEATLSPMARSFYGDNKRVSNQRIKQDLGVRLAYPSYRDGLPALLTERFAAMARALDQAWLSRQFEQAASILAADVVFASPTGTPILGREAAIASYRAFMDRATVTRFDSADHQVTVRGATAVLTYRWAIAWTDDDGAHEAAGSEILVLSQREGAWAVVWRSQRPDP